jgi:hypothetical protein
MRTIAKVVVCLVLGVTSTALRAEAQQPKGASAGSTQVSASPATELHFVNVLVLRGEVTAIDLADRRVTLKSPEGGTATLQVWREQDLRALKVGDQVTVRYFEGAQIRDERTEAAVPSFSLKNGMMGATLGGPSRKKHALFASVDKVDPVNQEVTLKGPDGSIETIMVTNPEYLSHVKVGDKVGMTRVQALALSLKKEN